MEEMFKGMDMLFIPITFVVCFVGYALIVYLHYCLYGNGEDKRERMAEEKAEAKAEAKVAKNQAEDLKLRFAELSQTVSSVQTSLIELRSTNLTLKDKNERLELEIAKLTKKNEELQNSFHAVRLEHAKEMAAMKASHIQAIQEVKDSHTSSEPQMNDMMFAKLMGSFPPSGARGVIRSRPSNKFQSDMESNLDTEKGARTEE